MSNDKCIWIKYEDRLYITREMNIITDKEKYIPFLAYKATCGINVADCDLKHFEYIECPKCGKPIEIQEAK